MRDNLYFVLFILLTCGALVWYQYCAPCSWHAGTPASELPSRCVPR